ncbi:circularly permuted type 2 ATP-grasp protein [Nigerium massiliense]|uniref:circularly permuted type 2 ATP-grasp protein n=1 Tax=Nigerium massiliense TaxID=1522317 RepID=UPI000694D253|nr:circularly permuted type 2 ATP-grasp protein [Nigerium massiliense]
MTVADSELPDALVDAYRPKAMRASGVDELVTTDGVRAGNDPLADALRGSGPTQLLAAAKDVQRFAADDGITYGESAGEGIPRPWQIDPLPVMITGAEWARLETGLAQRAMLLRATFDDLYGERRLLRSGTVPASAVLAHESFVRAASGIRTERRRLVQTATDLGRDASGEWTVLSDRTQAPSGAGYAMATRRIVSKALPRLHRRTDLARLRTFFHTWTAATQAVAPPSDRPPRVVLLTPGPDCETAYDQAFSASLLGFPLVEADDLVMEGGRVWLRTRDRLEQVDVVVRRVDEAFADPLDMRGDSLLGVPGLIEATRNGTVAVANPIGSGLLENPALHPFWPAIAREVLGEDLLLPTVQTWWCGNEASRSHVLANLDSLVIKPISHGAGRPVAGRTLAAGAREELAARIAAEPWAWVGQEALPLSTTPVVTRNGLEPRPFVLRSFGVHTTDGYEVFPGGLGRAGTDADEFGVTMLGGATAKDVWVVSSTDPAHRSWLARPEEPRVVVHRPSRDPLLTPRVADNLYWLGRYAERAEGTTRLLLVADDLAEDHSARPGTPGGRAMQAMFEAIDAVTLIGAYTAAESATGYLRAGVLDASRKGSVLSCARKLISSAQHIREIASTDIWPVLASLERVLDRIEPDDDQLTPHLERVLQRLLALAGITAHGMVRDATWAFLDAGARMERAQFTTQLVRTTLSKELAPNVESLVTEALLHVGDSILTHRRRTATGAGPSDALESTLDLLLADRKNPRSVGFQLDRLVEDFALIGDADLISRAAIINDSISDFDLTVLADDPGALSRSLGQLFTDLLELSDQIGRAHFVRQAPSQPVRARWSTPWQVA